MCLAADAGLEASGLELAGRMDAALFGEAPSRIVVTAPPSAGDKLAEIASAHDVSIARIGRMGGRRLVLGRHIDLTLAELVQAHSGGLERALSG